MVRFFRNTLSASSNGRMGFEESSLQTGFALKNGLSDDKHRGVQTLLWALKKKYFIRIISQLSVNYIFFEDSGTAGRDSQSDGEMKNKRVKNSASSPCLSNFSIYYGILVSRSPVHDYSAKQNKKPFRTSNRQQVTFSMGLYLLSCKPGSNESSRIAGKIRELLQITFRRVGSSINVPKFPTTLRKTVIAVRPAIRPSSSSPTPLLRSVLLKRKFTWFFFDFIFVRLQVMSHLLHICGFDIITSLHQHKHNR